MLGYYNTKPSNLQKVTTVLCHSVMVLYNLSTLTLMTFVVFFITFLGPLPIYNMHNKAWLFLGQIDVCYQAV